MVNQYISNPASQSQAVPPTKISSLPSATAIFGQAWSIYKQKFGTFLRIMAIPTIMPAFLVILTLTFFTTGGGGGLLSIISIILRSLNFTDSSVISLFILFLSVMMAVFLATLAGGGLFSIMSISIMSIIAGGELFSTMSISSSILPVILFFVIIFVCQTWGQTALLYAIKDNGKISVMESYQRGWHKILSYWWVSLLAIFIIMGGFLLLVVPGIIFSVWFSLAVFILITEDLKGMNALLKSREYVKGKWVGVFWRLFFIGAISLIISLAPILIFSFLKIPFALEISQSIIGLFLAPLVMTYLFLVYNNLKTIKGEIVFTPTRDKKTAFIFVGILGFLFISAIFILTIFLILLGLAALS